MTCAHPSLVLHEYALVLVPCVIKLLLDPSSPRFFLSILVKDLEAGQFVDLCFLDGAKDGLYLSVLVLKIFINTTFLFLLLAFDEFL